MSTEAQMEATQCHTANLIVQMYTHSLGHLTQVAAWYNSWISCKLYNYQINMVNKREPYKWLAMGPGILNFNPNTLDFVRSVKVGECFFEVAEVSGLNSTTKMGGMDGFLSQRFQGHQISVRNRMRFPLNQGIQGKKGKQNNFQKH
ncbi:uncharacterized protein [Pocillopora verrucosa]|uniref:uncharacterized protein isoform X2 n=1 Tax=Pocillopora verrucosa TaxID=203993 RepID=UPI0033401316